ncbi:MAG: hypothetical protein SWQ30_11810 [Thermodesulfobacteriota bacterium]|nr:hypothetical protein [Thermodesulfobacteriota bacterium]
MRTGLRSILLSVVAVALLIGTGVGYAIAAEQSVALSPTTADQPVGSSFTLAAFYEVDDGDNTLTGLGVRFHFDSTRLQFTGFSDILATDLFASEDQPQDDDENFDDDASTDKYVSIAWASVGGNWPNATLPLELVQLDFMVDEAATAVDTPVNVSFISNAAGYTASSTDSVITITIPPGSIAGTVTYTGIATGKIDIGAYSDANLENLVAETEVDTPGGDFEIADVPPGTYYVGAKLDLVERVDREPAGQAAGPVTVVSGQSADAGNIDVYHIATNIVLEADPAHISSMTVSESTLTATIWDDHGYVVTDGPDSTLGVLFAVTDPTYGDIKDVQINPVVAANGVATIIIESEVDDEGGDIPCTADATGGQGDLTQGTVTVGTGPFAIVPESPIALQVNGTQEFSVLGGVAPYAWSVDGGSLDKTTTQTADEKVGFTAPELETMGITIKVTDDDGIESQTTINVYETVEIPDKPTEPPIVEAGDSSTTFTVAGGDEDYIWTATDSGGTPIDVQEGNSYAFTAPMDGAFAGAYTIMVEDGNQFSDTFGIYVPMQFMPQSMNILAAEQFDLILAGADADNAQISDVAFLDEDLNVVPTEEMADYATFAPDVPIDFDENSEAVTTVTGADVTEAMRFQFRATVTGDTDLTEQNGLNVATTGWIRVLPAVTYSGIVQELGTGSPIAAAVVIFKLGGVIQGEPVLTSMGGLFDVELPSPSLGGPEYDVEVLADGYVSSTGLTTAGWDMVDGETIELTEEVSSVSGTVNDDVGGGAPIQGALVQCTADEQTCLAYTDALGEYEISLPVALDAINGSTTTWTYQTTETYANPCEPDEEDTGTATMTEVGNVVTIVVEDGPTFTGTVDGSDYHLTAQYSDGEETCTETVDFTLSSSTEASGTLTWSCTEGGATCNGGANLTLTKQEGTGPTELLATASAAGYTSVTQDILDDPDFVLTALASGDEVGPAGGTLTSGQCVVDVPPGALDGTAVIQFDCGIDVGTETQYTQNSVALVKIDVGANIAPNNPIQVTIPFDTTDVNPGDFMAGIARIYYAADEDDLRNSVVEGSVPVEDIVYEDHLMGLVSFWLSHTSVFGVGAGGAGGPTAVTGVASAITISTATLTGTINPNGLATTYHFEYGRDTAYGKTTAEADAGSGSDDVSVDMGIAKLKDDTVYHFRLVAMNSAGVTYGDDMTFKTREDDDICFIQTAASGFSLEQHVPLPATSACQALLVILMFGLVAGAYITLRRS